MYKRNQIIDAANGFLLLELMMAILIISISLVAAFNLQSISLTMACEAKFNTTAPLLAQKKMAEIEQLEPEDILSNSGTFEDFPDYNWNLDVEEPSFSEPENVAGHLKKLDLTVSWGEEEHYTYHQGMYIFSRD